MSSLFVELVSKKLAITFTSNIINNDTINQADLKNSILNAVSSKTPKFNACGLSEKSDSAALISCFPENSKEAEDILTTILTEQGDDISKLNEHDKRKLLSSITAELIIMQNKNAIVDFIFDKFESYQDERLEDHCARGNSLAFAIKDFLTKHIHECISFKI